MKHYFPVFMLLLLQFSVIGQRTPIATFMEPYPLEVTLNKTTNLVFPFGIKSVDRGSADILVQKANYIDTILQVKAARENFKETNLSVITTDGELYSFLLHYVPSPNHLNYLFGKDTNEKNQARPDNSSEQHEPADNEADYLRNVQVVSGSKRFFHGVKVNQYKIHLQLEGIYIKNDNLYFQLQLKNTSNLPYQIETLRFLIRDKKPAKRVSQQEIELKPIYSYGNTNTIDANASNKCVLVFSPFTIANSKYLVIIMSEKNAGRTMDLKIKDNKSCTQERSTDHPYYKFYHPFTYIKNYFL